MASSSSLQGLHENCSRFILIEEMEREIRLIESVLAYFDDDGVTETSSRKKEQKEDLATGKPAKTCDHHHHAELLSNLVHCVTEVLKIDIENTKAFIGNYQFQLRMLQSDVNHQPGGSPPVISSTCTLHKKQSKKNDDDGMCVLPAEVEGFLVESCLLSKNPSISTKEDNNNDDDDIARAKQSAGHQYLSYVYLLSVLEDIVEVFYSILYLQGVYDNLRSEEGEEKIVNYDDYDGNWAQNAENLLSDALTYFFSHQDSLLFVSPLPQLVSPGVPRGLSFFSTLSSTVRSFFLQGMHPLHYEQQYSNESSNNGMMSKKKHVTIGSPQREREILSGSLPQGAPAVHHQILMCGESSLEEPSHDNRENFSQLLSKNRRSVQRHVPMLVTESRHYVVNSSSSITPITAKETYLRTASNSSETRASSPPIVITTVEPKPLIMNKGTSTFTEGVEPAMEVLVMRRSTEFPDPILHRAPNYHQSNNNAIMAHREQQHLQSGSKNNKFSTKGTVSEQMMSQAAHGHVSTIPEKGKGTEENDKKDEKEEENVLAKTAPAVVTYYITGRKPKMSTKYTVAGRGGRNAIGTQHSSLQVQEHFIVTKQQQYEHPVTTNTSASSRSISKRMGSTGEGSGSVRHRSLSPIGNNNPIKAPSLNEVLIEGQDAPYMTIKEGSPRHHRSASPLQAADEQARMVATLEMEEEMQQSQELFKDRLKEQATGLCSASTLSKMLHSMHSQKDKVDASAVRKN